jgi:hypothetical protein
MSSVNSSLFESSDKLGLDRAISFVPKCLNSHLKRSDEILVQRSGYDTITLSTPPLITSLMIR